MAKARVAVLASGRGTDFQSIIDAKERSELDVEIVMLIVNNIDAKAIERAEKHRIPWKFIDHRGKSREDFEEEVIQTLEPLKVDLIVLAGFMRLVTPHLINRYPYRIINIHPALAPSFAGAHGHRDALRYGVKVSGCTIHFVDESVDGGPVILQKAVEVMDDDTEDTLSSRILEWEHIFLPLAVRLFSEGRLKVEGRRVRIDRKGFQIPPMA
jgi:phosphoribosylglycinamide formyltransferase-1